MKTFIQKLSFILFLFCLGSAGKAQTDSLYVYDKAIPVPGNGSYDYMSIDKVHHHLFVSHGTCVNVIDLTTDTVIDSIANMKGVHGIAIANEVNKGFISDGKTNSVVVFDLVSFKTITTIPLRGKKPDAIIYDPFSKKIFAFCGDSQSASIIDVTNLKETQTIVLHGAPEFAVSDEKGFIYNNLEDKSSIDVIDTKSLKVTSNFSLAPCGGPTGLAIDEQNKRLFTVCRENKGMSVVNISSNKVIATVPIGAGVDAVVYDAEDKLILCSNGDGTTTIIKQHTPDHYSVVQTLTTTYRAKTMAFDYETENLYLSAPTFDGNKKMISDTFKILVYKKAH